MGENRVEYGEMILEITRLRDALRFYADPCHYIDDWEECEDTGQAHPITGTSAVWYDKGKIARDTINKHGQKAQGGE